VKKPEQIVFGTEDRKLGIFYKRMLPYLLKVLPVINIPQENTNGKYNWLLKIDYKISN
jgi:hypothetical protein